MISIRACGLLCSQHRRCRDLLCLKRFSVLFYCAAVDAANTSRYFRSIIVGFLNRDCRGKAVVEVIPVVVVGLQFLAQRVPRIYRNRRNRVDCIEYLMIDADELVVGIFPGVHGSLHIRSGSIHFLHGQRVTRLVDTVGTELIMAVIVHRCRDFNFVQICTRICFYNAKSTTLADSRCLENLGQINAVFIGVGVRCSKRILVIGVVVVVMRCLQRSSICESIAQNDFRRLGIQGFEDIIHSLAIDTGGCDAVRNDQLITSWVSNRHIRSMILASNDRFARIHCNSDRSRIACLERYCCARCLVFINRNICTGRNRETAIARVGTIVCLVHFKSCRKRMIVIIGIIITNSCVCADSGQSWCRFVDVDGIADYQFRDKTSGGFLDIKLLSAEDVQRLIRIRFAALQCDILRWLYIIQRIAVRRGQCDIAVIPPDLIIRILGVCALCIGNTCVIAVDLDHFRIGFDGFVADTVVQVLFLGVIAPRGYRHLGRILSKFFLVFIKHRIIRTAYQSCFFGAVPIQIDLDGGNRLTVVSGVIHGTIAIQCNGKVRICNAFGGNRRRTGGCCCSQLIVIGGRDIFSSHTQQSKPVGRNRMISGSGAVIGCDQISVCPVVGQNHRISRNNTFQRACHRCPLRTIEGFSATGNAGGDRLLYQCDLIVLAVRCVIPPVNSLRLCRKGHLVVGCCVHIDNRDFTVLVNGSRCFVVAGICNGCICFSCRSFLNCINPKRFRSSISYFCNFCIRQFLRFIVFVILRSSLFRSGVVLI